MNSVEQRLHNPPKREFKVITIKTLKELGRRMDGQNENFNRVREYKEEQNRTDFHYSVLLTPFSVPSNLLLIPSSVFFISVIVFFSSVLFFFIFSNSVEILILSIHSSP